jgi:hypothetical protein
MDSREGSPVLFIDEASIPLGADVTLGDSDETGDVAAAVPVASDCVEEPVNRSRTVTPEPETTGMVPRKAKSSSRSRSPSVTSPPSPNAMAKRGSKSPSPSKSKTVSPRSSRSRSGSPSVPLERSKAEHASNQSQSVSRTSQPRSASGEKEVHVAVSTAQFEDLCLPEAMDKSWPEVGKLFAHSYRFVVFRMLMLLVL